MSHALLFREGRPEPGKHTGISQHPRWTRSIPGLIWGKRDDPTRWPEKVIPERDAVAVYLDSDGATITVIAAEFGVSEATLSA
jgi:hypothetical protein